MSSPVICVSRTPEFWYGAAAERFGPPLARPSSACALITVKARTPGLDGAAKTAWAHRSLHRVGRRRLPSYDRSRRDAVTGAPPDLAYSPGRTRCARGPRPNVSRSGLTGTALADGIRGCTRNREVSRRAHRDDEVERRHRLAQPGTRPPAEIVCSASAALPQAVDLDHSRPSSCADFASS